jgi:hypothetical protein
MRIVRLTAILLGILLILIAHQGELRGWGPLETYLVLGFIGYILIISAAAWSLLAALDRFLNERKQY